SGHRRRSGGVGDGGGLGRLLRQPTGHAAAQAGPRPPADDRLVARDRRALHPAQRQRHGLRVPYRRRLLRTARRVDGPGRHLEHPDVRRDLWRHRHLRRRPLPPPRTGAHAMTTETIGSTSYGTVESTPYPWPYDGTFTPQNTALICIDWQVDFCGPGGYVDAMGYDLNLTRAGLGPTAKLLAAMRERGFLVIHTR